MCACVFMLSASSWCSCRTTSLIMSPEKQQLCCAACLLLYSRSSAQQHQDHPAGKSCNPSTPCPSELSLFAHSRNIQWRQGSHSHTEWMCTYAGLQVNRKLHFHSAVRLLMLQFGIYNFIHSYVLNAYCFPWASGCVISFGLSAQIHERH